MTTQTILARTAPVFAAKRPTPVQAATHFARCALRTLCTALALLSWPAARAQFAAPFEADAHLGRADDGSLRLVVDLTVAPGHYLYADKTSITVAGDHVALQPESTPAPVKHTDPVLGVTSNVYARDTQFAYKVTGAPELPLTVTVRFQGCSDTACFPPKTVPFELALADAAQAQPAAQAAPKPVEPPTATDTAGAADTWREAAAAFRATGRAAGYLKPAAFLEFIDAAESGEGLQENKLSVTLQQKGVWLTIVLILLGGLALNLTPCVLPMIPVNIAIIGAGAQAGSRARGFALGAAYGLGIALTYGILGLVVVLTGARFGTLNANPWFNLAVAVVFLVLALAMFDVLTVDFSRFQSKITTDQSKRGSFLGAFFLGCVAALLAGACVAPVVIWVLLLSANLFAGGNPAALALPFLLGLGMALPWPVAGAGLSMLPKPGRWMERIRQAFGVIIVAMALWYGRLGVKILVDRARPSAATAEHGEWQTSLTSALEQAREQGKPVFIDFWATWCKNCSKMEKVTFPDSAVQQRLAPYIKLKFQAEDMDAPDIKPILDHYDVLGLPTYVVLEPNAAPSVTQ